ncbi:MAG: hypothetical protein J6Z38_01875, partial [Lachnospiraceae bacterium]|nr:hypothetical protein [Lachnospiraceae bacterium]
SYDKANRYFPYWGMRGGDLMKYLAKQGFPCHAASVSPEGSAWDRACELYAQLAGRRVDYGKAHSLRCAHERFGKDFSGQPLIPDWESGKKIVLFGHSFGGATIRLFSELLANGSAEERQATEDEDLSAFFRGGQGGRLHALVTLAAPTNGTTAYDLYNDPSFDVSAVRISRRDEFWGNIFSRRKTAASDGRIREDHAAFDMHIDNALALNERIETLPYVYYFAVPCAATRASGDGVHSPVRRLMEPMFRRTSTLMGSYTGTTAGGFVIDASWRENDGLVNTVSAKAPLNAPSVPYERGNVQPGIWQLMPVFRGDHMSLQGGMMKKSVIRPFYRELLEMIGGLPFTD